MSPTDASARPSQVTVAGWAIAVASALLVVGVFDAMTNLHSVDTRDQVLRALSTGSAKGLGLSLDGALTAMRWALFVSGAAAAAAGILGVFVLQRNRGARIGLTVAAVPIVLAAPITGSYLGVFVGGATAVLWSRPARDWFAGRQSTPRPQQVSREETPADQPPAPQQPPSPTAPAPWVPPTSQPGPVSAPVGNQPPPTVGWGQVPPVGPAFPNPYGPPPPFPPATGMPVRSSVVPRQVRTACILTWVVSGITALAYLMVLAAILINSDGLMRAVKKSPTWDPSFDENVVLRVAVVMSVLFLLWCVAAAVLAVFAWRGVTTAWILLLVSAGLATLVSIVAFPYSLVHLTALAFTARNLLAKPARDWYSSR